MDSHSPREYSENDPRLWRVVDLEFNSDSTHIKVMAFSELFNISTSQPPSLLYVYTITCLAHNK